MAQSTSSAPGPWLTGLLGVMAGGMLLVGLLTPVAGLVVGLGALGIGCSLFPMPVPNLFDAKLSVFLTDIMSAAIVFLGPGAFSLDARLFGRREIIIPPAHRHRDL